MSARVLLRAFEEEFQKNKSLADRAIVQVDDAGLHVQINPQQNSIAAIMQHIAGNAISRWTDFLTADGEKPDRDRESEFIDRKLPRVELLALWERGWKCMFDALTPLTDADMLRVITIRREQHTLCRAIARQMGHYGWHAGQIALIAKHLRQGSWQYLTIAPGQTAEYNSKMGI